MHLVDDHDLEPIPVWSVGQALLQAADVLDAVVAGPVDLQHVQIVACGDLEAWVASIAGLRCRSMCAVERLGEQASGARLADPAGAREEIGVGHAPALDRVADRAGDVFLPHQIAESLGAVFASKDGVGHSEGAHFGAIGSVPRPRRGRPGVMG